MCSAASGRRQAAASCKAAQVCSSSRLAGHIVGGGCPSPAPGLPPALHPQPGLLPAGATWGHHLREPHRPFQGPVAQGQEARPSPDAALD